MGIGVMGLDYLESDVSRETIDDAVEHGMRARMEGRKRRTSYQDPRHRNAWFRGYDSAGQRSLSFGGLDVAEYHIRKLREFLELAEEAAKASRPKWRVMVPVAYEGGYVARVHNGKDTRVDVVCRTYSEAMKIRDKVVRALTDGD